MNNNLEGCRNKPTVWLDELAQGDTEAVVRTVTERAYGELTRSADEVRNIAETLDGLDPDAVAARSMGMGHEGRAAAKYWTSLASLIPGELSFPGRQTRHATDPVNSAVNYVYGMLYGEVWRSVVRAGLDPYFGIMHGRERDQGSLVFDLIEEYRAPFADRVVVGMLEPGFDLELDKEGRLRNRCRRKLVSAFHKIARAGGRAGTSAEDFFL